MHSSARPLTRDEIIASGTPELVEFALDVRNNDWWLHGRFDGWSCVNGEYLQCPAGNRFSYGCIMGSFFQRQMPGFGWIAAQLEAGQPVMPFVFRD